jgi:AmmeMemoRadiSam system protein B
VRRDAAIGPAVAGSWYPRDPDQLARRVDALLAVPGERAAAPAVAIIAPHAGFDYSGAVAASAFAELRGRQFDRVILLGPSHHFGFPGAAVPDAATALQTPLGDVPIDRAAIAALGESRGFRADDRVFAPEHALEAELPFLQRVLASIPRIVPVLLGGGASKDDARRVAEALLPWIDAATLIVVSSDFTHFGRRFGFVPFTDDVPSRIRELDHGAIRAIEAGDASEFARFVDRTGATICGHRAIDVLLLLPAASAGGRLLAYDTSGRMTGTWDHSVSYAAIALPGAGGAPA